MPHLELTYPRPEIAVVTLNRPEKLNALSYDLVESLHTAIDDIANNGECRVVVLTGAGRGFCAGADMNDLSALSNVDQEAAAAPFAEPDAPPPGDPSWGDDLRGTYTYLLSVPKPIIAAINGPVAGMGVPIALACDLRIMSESAVLTTSFAQRGLVAEWGLSWLLTRLVGPSHALDLLFSARRVDGAEAFRLGLVNRTVPADQTLTAAQDYVRELARGSSPASMAVMKRQVYTELHAGLGVAERHAIELMLESFGRPDFKEGVASFLERRDPQFGRLGSG